MREAGLFSQGSDPAARLNRVSKQSRSDELGVTAFPTPFSELWSSRDDFHARLRLGRHFGL